MKYLDEYRNADLSQKLVDEIRRIVTRPWVLMEVCGGQTHSIVRHGIDQLLPATVELVHGPGCPVCVTPVSLIDRAHALARRPEVIFCSFGDMLRVPGSDSDLLTLKSQGASIRVVYSPLDCLRIARENPGKEVVFFAIGFETTAPANAILAWQAREMGLKNLSLLVAHVLVPPAMASILDSKDNRVQGFLGPGHVCTVVGYEEYELLAARYRVPIVITGFEPVDLLQGILMVLRQLEEGRAAVENQYPRVVRREGNRTAREWIERVFEGCDREWRGAGRISASGYRLRSEFQAHDAERRFDLTGIVSAGPGICLSGQILQGAKKPHDCPAFGTECTPEHPLGPTMVSSEGACAAYYVCGRHRDSQRA
jgi:hydrogenase expression/formation protein HypD